MISVIRWGKLQKKQNRPPLNHTDSYYYLVALSTLFAKEYTLFFLKLLTQPMWKVVAINHPKISCLWIPLLNEMWQLYSLHMKSLFHRIRAFARGCTFHKSPHAMNVSWVDQPQHYVCSSILWNLAGELHCIVSAHVPCFLGIGG